MEDDNSYKGWLNSNSFFKRCMAVTGYCMLGSLIIYAVLFVFLMFLGMFIQLGSM